MANQFDDVLRTQGTDGDDVMVGTWDQDILWGLGGDDILRGEGGSDILLGHEGSDQLFGDDEGDSLDGGAGDDVAYGGQGDDVLRDPDGGSDSLYGEGGDDRLTIDRFRGLGEAVFLSGGEGNDVIYAAIGTYNSAASSTVSIDGGSGDDYVYASGLIQATVSLGAGNDRVVVSSWGNHVLTLGEGHDVLELGSSDGIFTINDFEAGDFGDRIDLAASMSRAGSVSDPESNPFHAGTARLSQVGPDAHLTFGGTTIVLKNVTVSELTASNFAGADPVGGPGFPGANFFGSAQGEQIWASPGGDQIEGFAGDDSLMGLGGDDVIRGGLGDDTLDGGAGDDMLHGGDGDDLFEEYQGNGGHDAYYGEGGSDTFNLRRLDGGESVSIWGGTGDDFVSTSGPLGILYVDGGDGDDSIGVGNVDSWRVDGGAGSDHLGLGSAYRNSELFFGAGVFDGGSGQDWVYIGEAAQGLEIVGIDDVSFRIGDAVMRNVEAISVGAMDAEFDISGMSHGLTVVAEAGRNVLTGSAHDDVLAGKYFDDTLDGGDGYDTAVFDREFRFYEIETRDGMTTVECIGDSADVYGTDTLRNIERLQFEDGWYTLDGTYIPAVITGTGDADELAGKSWSDTLLAGGGDDRISVTKGNDVIDGGDGHDTVYVGEYLPSYFKLLASGDDFLLCGPYGMTTLLRDVETLVFLDGSIVELNRIYGPNPPVPPASAKDQGPLVLPGGSEEPLLAGGHADRRGLLLRLEASGADFDPNAGWALTLPLHPDWG